jgi:hypothetical protein
VLTHTGHPPQRPGHGTKIGGHALLEEQVKNRELEEAKVQVARSMNGDHV